jgi:hypothetical protein
MAGLQASRSFGCSILDESAREEERSERGLCGNVQTYNDVSICALAHEKICTVHVRILRGQQFSIADIIFACNCIQPKVQ